MQSTETGETKLSTCLQATGVSGGYGVERDNSSTVVSFSTVSFENTLKDQIQTGDVKYYQKHSSRSVRDKCILGQGGGWLRSEGPSQQRWLLGQSSAITEVLRGETQTKRSAGCSGLCLFCLYLF